MRQKSRNKPEPAHGNDGEDDAASALDETLRQMGEAFLEKEVPDSLLEVLRRGMASPSKKEPSEPEGKTVSGQGPAAKKQG